MDAISGDFVCRKCGEIQGSRLIVESSEVRHFHDNEVPQHSEERHGGQPDSNAWVVLACLLALAAKMTR